MGLPEFLRARLDELEAAAKAPEGSAIWHEGSAWFADMLDPLPSRRREYPAYIPMITEADVRHIALNDPAYVLADVAAKRRIVDWAMALLETLPNDPGAALMFEQAGNALLHLLAAPHADHPDFDPAWKVD